MNRRESFRSPKIKSNEKTIRVEEKMYDFIRKARQQYQEVMLIDDEKNSSKFWKTIKQVFLVKFLMYFNLNFVVM